MSCTLNTILAGAQAACEESFSGIGSSMYIGLVSDLTVKPSKSDVNPDKAEFVSTCFQSLKGKLVKWDIEEETGEVTYDTNAGGGGFNNHCEVTVRKNMHRIAHDLRILNNVKFLVFVPAAEGYYVFYSAMGSAKLEEATGTTGKSASDEHGHTIKVLGGPMYYPMMTWVPGVDLDDWCIPETTSGSKFAVTYTSGDFTVTCDGTEIASGSKVAGGSIVRIEATEGNTLTSVTVGSKSIDLDSDTSASLVVTAETALTVVTAEAD